MTRHDLLFVADAVERQHGGRNHPASVGCLRATLWATQRDMDVPSGDRQQFNDYLRILVMARLLDVEREIVPGTRFRPFHLTDAGRETLALWNKDCANHERGSGRRSPKSHPCMLKAVAPANVA